MGKWVHRILVVNEETLTVTCASCGEVPGTRKKGRLICSVANNEMGRRNYTPKPKKVSLFKQSPVNKHGLSKAERDALKQGTTCFSCGEVEIDRLAVDHDHLTGKIRGILCKRCNSALGLLRDNPNIIRKLAEYIENPPLID